MKIWKLIIISLLTIGCNRNILNENTHFNIVESYSQNWVKSENERGTLIYFCILPKSPNISFDTIIYNQYASKIDCKSNSDSIFINANIPSIQAKIYNPNKKSFKLNCLIYRIGSKKYEWKFDSIPQRKTKYFF